MQSMPTNHLSLLLHLQYLMIIIIRSLGLSKDVSDSASGWCLYVILPETPRLALDLASTSILTASASSARSSAGQVFVRRARRVAFGGERAACSGDLAHRRSESQTPFAQCSAAVSVRTRDSTSGTERPSAELSRASCLT